MLHASGYPQRYAPAVATALDYVQQLVQRLPGPVEVSPEAYARDPLVHALFPSLESLSETLSLSRALQDYYQRHPEVDELYALMGMRRQEKTLLGLEPNGKLLQHDVLQTVVYFTGHTLDLPAPSTTEARQQITLSLLDSLADKVKKRLNARKLDFRERQKQKDLLISRLRLADERSRPALEAELAALISSLQADAGTLDIEHYLTEFETVLGHPEQHLKLVETAVVLDRMGIMREQVHSSLDAAFTFQELIDYDRRNWTVVLAHCTRLQSLFFAARMEQASRTLVY